MNKKLYVGNLSFETTQDELQALFVEIGPVVSAVIVTDGSTGRSRGFGFVEMETEQAAKDAIERLNGQMVGMRSINVNEARPPRERSSGGGRGRGGPGGKRRRSSRGGSRHY
jgi:RNA recognition motif-containing protein